MNPEDLRDLLRVRPFQPFRLHLTDGSHYDVRHPELIAVARRVAGVGIGGPQDQGIAERLATISLLHIVRVEPLESVPGAGQAAQG